MLEENINMQPCKDGNWPGGKNWTTTLNAFWMDLMVAPCRPIKLLTTKTSLVVNTTKPQTL